MGFSFTSPPCLEIFLWGNTRVERIHKAILRHYRLEQHGSVSPITGNAQGRGRKYGGMSLGMSRAHTLPHESSNTYDSS